MINQIMKFVLIVAWLMCGNSAIGKEITLDLSITGYAGESNVDAVLQFYSEPTIAPSSRTISNEHRNEYGHFTSRIQPGFNMGEISELYILGKIRNETGEDVAYIPLLILNKSELNERGFAELTTPSVISIESAFENSFPFSRGFHAGFINNKNLKQVLFSTRLLIEKGYVDGERWGVVFTSFLQNIQFFRDNTAHIAEILRFLRTYGNLANNKEYYEFYAKTLVKLDRLGVDGTEVAPNESLGRYVQKEWETLLIEHPFSVVPVVRSMLDTLFQEKRYSDCIDLGGLAFKNFQTQEVVDAIVNDRESRNYVLSAMQGTTECFQLDFALRSAEGSRSDVEGATSFLRTDKETSVEVSHFIELYEILEGKGILPRRPEKTLPKSEASRIQEIGRYYWWFTES